ncbi:undecaprenyl-phosphate glucose phosphotransferase [Labrys sp. KNU-23]|uniref:undecaprenyl-phosphate glucose phosphotransferase n=1 Tax=Labrys sp. KNU-23 TaxID=2789216 RepID=UPI0011EFF39F|nr:undecaprenyl-phosphate glucose phosphotransferase [Labrys sp. KNU-23]QEN85030.1 undecaprenyl-phosphate glucose phosphotransferase [Labrys sp. KNU-23]
MPKTEKAYEFPPDNNSDVELPSARTTSGYDRLEALNSNIPTASRYQKYTDQTILSATQIVDFVAIFILCGLLISIFTMKGLNVIVDHGFRIAVVGFVGVRCLRFLTRYRIETIRNPFAKPDRHFIAWSSGFVLMALTAYLLAIPIARSAFQLAIWYILGLMLYLGVRILIALLIGDWTKEGRMKRRTIVIGDPAAAKQLISLIGEQTGNQVEICGIFDDFRGAYTPSGTVGHCPIHDLDGLLEFARASRIEMLILALPLIEQRRIAAILDKVWVLPIEIKLSAHDTNLPFRPRAYSYIGSIAMIDLLDSPIKQWHYVTKRIFDLVFGVLGLIVLSPLMIATAFAIRMESGGPVLFRQKRHGFNNEVIEIWKFRSMYADMCDPSARNAVVRGDPRVTRVGRIIRKSSIDELPQLFNVLAGQISLVGPRPHAIAARTQDIQYNEVVTHYFARHRVKPGITGWAQINGWRGEIDSGDKIEKRTEFDLYYIEHWSIWFDIKILILTPIRLLNSQDTY